MKAYLVANVSVGDPEAYAVYRAEVPAVIARYGGRYLIRAGEVERLEGELPLDRFVVIEFPSREAARRFYDSPEYAPLLAIRSGSASSSVAIVHGYENA